MKRDTGSDDDLDSSIQYSSTFDPKRITPRVALLSGATGFLGANLLYELLTRTSLEIVCLIRADNDAHAKLRLRRALEAQELWRADFERRITPVVGDLTMPGFDLPPPEFNSLAHKVDLIYHNGAQISLVLPYKGLTKANVSGTQEMLRLASIGPPKALHHVSSLAVFHSPTYQQLSEIGESFCLDKLAVPARGYARSKWTAEQLINTAAQRGLSASIYRPDLITGHSRTGICNVRDILSLMLRASIRLGAAPIFPGEIHLTPVDFVSTAIVALSQLQLRGTAFHLRNPKPVPWYQIAVFLRTRELVERILPYDEWLQRVRTRASESSESLFQALSALLSDSHPPYSSTHQRVREDHTVAGLLDFPEIRCPPE